VFWVRFAMTNNHKQENISYDDLIGGLQDRYAYMLANDMYNGMYHHTFEGAA